jgi:hypothetical protein
MCCDDGWSRISPLFLLRSEFFFRTTRVRIGNHWKIVGKIGKLTMMYKLVNGLVLVNTEDRLIPPDRISRKNNTKVDYSATFWMRMQKKKKNTLSLNF